MSQRYILALDQGTTSSRALIVDEAGQIVAAAQHPFEQIYPQPGWVEHRPEDIWLTTRDAAREAIAAAEVQPRDIAGIGITNQRETIVVWERATGNAVANAIVWQDRRTAAMCDRLRASGIEPAIMDSTGLRLDPYFSATKLAWLLDNTPGLRHRAASGELAAGTIDSWLIWKLTNGTAHATDFTNASRTLLFSVRRGRWDEALHERLGVPMGLLPTPRASRASYGATVAVHLGAEIPILAVAGDQQSALFGQGCTEPGMAKATYGTGAFLLAHAGNSYQPSANGVLVSLGAGSGKEGPEYVAEGSVFVAGAAVQWLRDGLGIINEAVDIEELAASVPDAGGVEFVPAFTGLGSPYWDPYARGELIGLTRGTTRAHIARATLEAIALSCTDVIAAMEADLGHRLQGIRVDGGAASDDLLLQLQADYAGLPVTRAAETEATALGAAHLAGIEAGIWPDARATADLWRAGTVFEPRMSHAERLTRLERWRQAVDRARDWARE